MPLLYFDLIVGLWWGPGDLPKCLLGSGRLLQAKDLKSVPLVLTADSIVVVGEEGLLTVIAALGDVVRDAGEYEVG